MLSKFDFLYKHLKNNGLFLYNNGAKLRYVNKYDRNVKMLN